MDKSGCEVTPLCWKAEEYGHGTFVSRTIRACISGVAAAVAAMASFPASGSLPEDYCRVEWIQSTGSQWVDTGVSPGPTTGVEMDFCLSSYDNVSYLFGTEVLNTGYSLETRNSGFNFYGGAKVLLPYAVGNDYLLSIVPGEEGSTGTATMTNLTSGVYASKEVTLACTSSKTLALFALNGGAKPTRYRLRRMTISQDGEVVRDFIPCVNRITRAAGLYDAAGGAFYGNSGSGSFGAGPVLADSASVRVESAGYPFSDSNGLPAYGTTSGFAIGSRISLSAPQRVEYSGFDVYCRGWRRYNCATGELVAESGADDTTLCEFDFDVPSRVVWLWEVEGASSATVTFTGVADCVVLTNFPALVELGPWCGFTGSLASGNVRFSLGGADELPSEFVERTADGTARFWVRVPLLRKGSVIKAEWGNSVSSRRGQIARVWDTGYTSVYGLNETSGRAALDNTANLMLGSAATAPAEVAGIVGKARLFSSTAKDYFALGSTQRTPNLYSGSTLECWFRYEDIPSGTTPFLMYYPNYSAYNYGIDISLNGSGTMMCRVGYGGYATINAFSASPYVWHHAMVTFDSSRNLKFYLDGALQGTVANTSSKFPSGDLFDHIVYAGGRGDTGNNPRNVTLDGTLDEIRISSLPRSPEYAAAVYANLNDRSIFQCVTPGFEGEGEALPVPSAYTVSVSSGSGGSVSRMGDISVGAGEILSLTAVASDSSTAFYAWEGDVATQQIFTASIDLPADRDRSVRALFGKAYYVSPAGDDANDGLSLATAKAKISSAVAAITEYPAVVLVDDGVYSFADGDTVTLADRIAVRALNKGWKAAVNLMRGDNRRAFKLTSLGAVIDGLVITNAYGKTWNANGLGADIDSGHVQNCLFGFGRYGAFHCVDVYLRKGWVINSTFTGDVLSSSAWGVSGAIWAKAGLVDSCVFSNNNWQAGICIDGSAEMHNSLIVGNTASDASNARGGGVYLGSYTGNHDTGGGRGYLVNCTIADNTSRKYAGGVFSPGKASGYIVNCAFGGNNVSEAANGVDFFGKTILVNSLSAYCEPLLGSKVGVPDFTDAEGGDYTVTGVSPTRDIGLLAGFAVTPGAKDLAGNPRVLGKSVDAGCFEYVAGDEPFSINVEAGALAGEDSLTVDFSVLVAGSGNVSYAWDFGDGTSSSEAAPRHEYTKPGYYTVRVVVTNEESESVPKESLVFEREAMIKVNSSVMYVAAPGESVPTPPYATWETAADSLLAAYSLAPSKAIILGEGTIRGGGELNISIPVAIKGQGPDKTILDASSGRIYLGVPGVTVADLAIVNAPPTWNSGHINTTSGTVISNCVVSGGFSYNSGVVSMNGGKIVDSVVRNVKNVNGAAAGIIVRSGESIVDRCVISNCVSDLSGGNHYYGNDNPSVRGAAVGQIGGTLQLRNSLICGNVASAKEMNNKPVSNFGGAVYVNAASIESCTIAGNVVSNGVAGGVWFFGSDSTVINSIIAENRSACTNGEGEVVVTEDNMGLTAGKTVDIRYSCVPGYEGDSTCIDKSPLFNMGRSSARPYWALTGKSPCANAGLKFGWMEEASDIAGNRRLLGRRPDIGCYENDLSSLVLMLR